MAKPPISGELAMSFRFAMRIVVAIAAALAVQPLGTAAEPNLPLAASENFEQGADRWAPTDPKAWKVDQIDGNHVYSQFNKTSDYKPPHRSPFNISLLKDVYVGDFVLTARVKSTHEDYPHRDACLVFGWQDPAHFYYVHFGKRADDHANQIFIVNDAPRTKISVTSTEGTNWSDDWHQVKVVRRVEDGVIEVYFDDMQRPVMTAKDNTFAWGGIGVGSFDDTSQWDDVKLYGRKVDRPAKEAK
jgi:hypothetical protein